MLALLVPRAAPAVIAACAVSLAGAGQAEESVSAAVADARSTPESGRYAIRAAKAVTCAGDGASVVLAPVVVVDGGKIASIGPEGEVEIPADCEVLDFGDAWLTPGLVDLHSHIAGSGDINDMVLQTNPGLRVSSTVIPGNDRFDVPIAAGVTTILYIPGSGTNIGGQGVLLKIAHDTYETALLRDPGSLKIAQGDNPTRWGFGMRRGLMAWNIASVLKRGRAYARAFERAEAAAASQDGSPDGASNGSPDGAAPVPMPEREIDLDIFRELYANRTQVSTHTQYYHLVLTTVTMLARDFGLPAYMDHSSFDSYLVAPLARRHGVGAILGPRQIHPPAPPRFDTDGRIEGTAWGFEQQGTRDVGFNTDAPVVPQEDLPTQAAMGVRFGLSNDRAQGLRGVTIVPARIAGIDDRVGSLEVGKDADILVTNGDPVDPRTTVHAVFVDGLLRYDSERDGRRW